MAPTTNVLVYLQEVGGTRYLAPALPRFLERCPSTLVAHPMAAKTALACGLACRPLAEFTASPPVPEQAWAEALRSARVSHVVCTLSSPKVDGTNSGLVAVCRSLGIPTLGVMDHWKGYDRFFDDEGAPSFVPTRVCCIDEHCREGFRRFKCEPGTVRVVGHPHLEALWKRRGEFAGTPNGSATRILVVSQSEVREGRFCSIFTDDSLGILARVASSAQGCGVPVELRYRPHPKEPADMPLPDPVRLDPTATWDEALRDHDVFFGIDSMMLVEAALVGKQCVSLAMPELEKPLSVAIPYRVSEPVRDLAELPAQLGLAAARAKRHEAVDTAALQQAVQVSLDRTAKALEEFSHE